MGILDSSEFLKASTEFSKGFFKKGSKLIQNN